MCTAQNDSHDNQHDTNNILDELNRQLDVQFEQTNTKKKPTRPTELIFSFHF